VVEAQFERWLFFIINILLYRSSYNNNEVIRVGMPAVYIYDVDTYTGQLFRLTYLARHVIHRNCVCIDIGTSCPTKTFNVFNIS